MNKNSKIYVAGGQSGLAGTAIVRKLKESGYTKVVTRSRKELDLQDLHQVEDFFEYEKPEYVFLAAALVGGIMANKTRKADFIYDNLQIQNNVIHSAWKYKVKKLMFLGSSCVYPRLAKQPIREEYFMTGPVEETNDSYAIAKIAGIRMCQGFNDQHKTNFISVMPTNLYGPNDNFDLQSSHVLPSMIRKFHEAKEAGDSQVIMWGTGCAYREFLHVDDLADACIFLMNNYDGSEIINIGTGKDQTIKEMAEIVKDIVGYKGNLTWDTTKPDGMPKKQLDISRLIALGWEPKIDLNDGIKSAYKWFLDNFTSI